MDDDDFVRIRVLQSCVRRYYYYYFFFYYYNTLIMKCNLFFSVRFERVVVIGIIEYILYAPCTRYVLYF